MVKVLTRYARIYIPDSRLFDADEKADWAARYKTSESLDTLQTLTNQTGKREFSVKKGTNETATLCDSVATTSNYHFKELSG